jgi:tRNA (guanosine-2'-O-)-methyltransferase
MSMVWRRRETRHQYESSKGAQRPGAVSAAKSRPGHIRRARRQRRHRCWDHIIVAPLWVAYQANLGTLLRTCDAVGACIALPDTDHYRQALTVGDSRRLRDRSCVHWLDTGKDRWVRIQRAEGWQIVAVELAEGAVSLPRLEPARGRTVVLLGHETAGLPEEHVQAADVCVEIPMVGIGASLNVAVAGSLVLYRLAGLA